MREGWNETKVLPRMSVETTKTTKDQERESQTTHSCVGLDRESTRERERERVKPPTDCGCHLVR